MNLWHLTSDTPRLPHWPSQGQAVTLWIGTWPIEPGQKVWVEYKATRDGKATQKSVEAVWNRNEGENSYWSALLPGFQDGDNVTYTIKTSTPTESIKTSPYAFRVGPKIHLAILWHHHQPLYRETNGKKETYRLPWVRLHAIRDYYAMASLAAQYPKVHMTFNFVPSLLMQIEGYVERGATDHALDLTRKPASRLTITEKDKLLSTFFDASWHNQIGVHPRYKELFEKRLAGGKFSLQDLTDLQMWSNLAWFAPEFLESDVRLHDGTTFNLKRFVQKAKGFSQDEIESMIEAQFAVMRNIVFLHRSLQEAGQIEVSTTPFYHPILPLIHDASQATIDRMGAFRPPPFQFPEDAGTQVERAASFYEARFGRKPNGMWPAEGAIGPSILDHFIRAGVHWLATDQGVLEKSGQWGYRTENPDVLCQPYRAEAKQGVVSIFFRDRALSDAIGFKFQNYPDQAAAAKEFVRDLKVRLAYRVSDPENRVVTVVLDGENAWGSYKQAGRPFFHALYQLLSEDPEIKTVTFSEYLSGNPQRFVPAHGIGSHERVHDLFNGSWIDEWGSSPGVDHGTWIGEEEENRGWELLAAAREKLKQEKLNPKDHGSAFESAYAAEGSDWFWWFGKDQESGFDEVFDDLFRGHLKSVYKAIHRKPPVSLNHHIVPHAVTWTFTAPVRSIQKRDRLTVRTNCAGFLRWSMDGGQTYNEASLIKAGGVMTGLHSYSLMIDRIPETAKAVDFMFRCTECGCQEGSLCCGEKPQRVLVRGGE